MKVNSKWVQESLRYDVKKVEQLFLVDKQGECRKKRESYISIEVDRHGPNTKHTCA